MAGCLNSPSEGYINVNCWWIQSHAVPNHCFRSGTGYSPQKCFIQRCLGHALLSFYHHINCLNSYIFPKQPNIPSDGLRDNLGLKTTHQTPLSPESVSKSYFVGSFRLGSFITCVGGKTAHIQGQWTVYFQIRFREISLWRSATWPGRGGGSSVQSRCFQRFAWKKVALFPDSDLRHTNCDRKKACTKQPGKGACSRCATGTRIDCVHYVELIMPYGCLIHWMSTTLFRRPAPLYNLTEQRGHSNM